MLNIKIKYHTDIEKISKIEKGDWIDLRAAEDVFIRENESALISLGVSMKLPEGYEAYIVPRSSTFKNYGIIQTNHTGIIDNSYSGTNDVWKFSAYCLKGRHCNAFGSEIKKGDRICQFRIVEKQPLFDFEEVDSLDDNGRGGFGSSGVK